MAGCALYSPRTRVIGISADDPAPEISDVVRRLLREMETTLEVSGSALGAAVDVDDSFVGEGYGIPTDASREAQQMAAQFEAIVLDHWYTAKAMAGLIARARSGAFNDARSVVFWHTGGQPGVLA